MYKLTVSFPLCRRDRTACTTYLVFGLEIGFWVYRFGTGLNSLRRLGKGKDGKGKSKDDKGKSEARAKLGVLN